jgi:hypothetical protein
VKRTMTQTLTPEEMATLEGYLASKGPPPATDLDTRLKEAAVALAVATVASCDCHTKTPDPEHHRSDCTYASLRMAIARVDRIISRRAALSPPESGDVALTDPNDTPGWPKGFTRGQLSDIQYGRTNPPESGDGVGDVGDQGGEP